MKKLSLQMQYNILHILYWITSCTIYGYVAIFLQYKDLSNTEIGIVTGVGAIASIFISPFISSLISKIKGLSIKKLILILYCMMFIIFALMIFIPLSIIIIMILYMVITCLIVSIVPFLSMICMNYLKNGEYLNFGLSRGMGSVSYAVSAFVLGQLINWINPTVIAYVHFITSILLLYLLYLMPDCEMKNDNKQKDESSAITIIKSYKVFFWILISYAFVFGASTALSTYLINIVKKLGGNTSLYGVAVFCTSASEMPVMAITHQLLKKFKSETLIFISIVFYFIRNLIICIAPSLPIFLIGMIFQGFSYGLFTATITYYVSDYLKQEHQMMGQTLIGMMSSGLGSAVGNIFGGILQDTFGLDSMLIFVCVLSVISVILITLTLKNKITKKSH